MSIINKNQLLLLKYILVPVSNIETNDEVKIFVCLTQASSNNIFPKSPWYFFEQAKMRYILTTKKFAS